MRKHKSKEKQESVLFCGLARGSLEAMSRTRSSGEKNDCPNALHSAQSELRGAASSILKIAEQLKEKVDEEDVELKKLRREMGVSVFKAVKRGLEEINEHNPSGRYPVAKLWHVEDNREARLDEIVECMVKKTTPKRKREDNATNTGASATKGMS